MRVRKSLVVESCAHGLDTRGAYQVAGCSKAPTFRACNSGAVAFALLLVVQSRDWVPGRCKYYGATSGRGVLQNLHPLTNFKATIPAQASAIAAYSGRTESTVNLVTVWTVACSSYPSPFASSLKAQPTNECLSLLHSVYSFVNCIERPMKIEIVVDPLRPAPPASLASRVAPAPSTAAAATEPRGTRFVQQGLLRPHLCLTN